MIHGAKLLELALPVISAYVLNMLKAVSRGCVYKKYGFFMFYGKSVISLCMSY